MKIYTLEEQKANRKLWIEALRSGKYKQGREKLRLDDDTMCCMGVLSEIAGCEWHGTFDPCYGDFYRVVGEPNNDAAGAHAKAFVGLRSDDGHYEATVGHTLMLTAQNDGGVSFEEIADIIESEPPGLFAESA